MGHFLVRLIGSMVLYAILSPSFGPLAGFVAFILPLLVLAIRVENKENHPT